MFMCGTAALIAPIKSVLYKDYEIVSKEEFGPLSKALRQRIEDIQVLILLLCGFPLLEEPRKTCS